MIKIYRLLTITVAFTLLIIAGGNAVYAQDHVQLIALNSESPAGTIQRITNGLNGTEPDWNSDDTSISADGRFVAFSSSASNLIVGDTNHVEDIFVYDRFYETIERVSIASDGTQGVGGPSFATTITPDGRFVAFLSWDINLVKGDTNGFSDVFVHDRQTGITERVSVASDGSQGNKWVESNRPFLSSDGRYVVFASTASNMVSGDNNSTTDIFVHDRQTGGTELVSVASDGSQGNNWSDYPAISADGRYVVFNSFATNLIDEDTNGAKDVFVHDRQTGTTEIVSLDLTGSLFPSGAWCPSITADGRFIAFTGWDNPSGLENVYVYDRQNHITEIVSIASDGSFGRGFSSRDPSISADGRFVAFSSSSYDLAPGGINNGLDQIYLRDRETGITERISKDINGNQGNNASSRSFISPNGGYIAFISAASNLVSGDMNNTLNVYVYNRIAYQPAVFSITGFIALADGTPLPNVIVSSGDSQSITDANGQYILSGLAVGQYTLTPVLDGYTFSPPFIQVTLSKTDVTGKNFTAQAVIVNYPNFFPAIYHRDD